MFLLSKALPRDVHATRGRSATRAPAIALADFAIAHSPAQFATSRTPAKQRMASVHYKRVTHAGSRFAASGNPCNRSPSQSRLQINRRRSQIALATVTDGTRPDVLRKLELALQESIQDPVVIELDDAQLQPGFVGTIETKAKINADVEKIIRIIGEVKLDTPR